MMMMVMVMMSSTGGVGVTEMGRAQGRPTFMLHMAGISWPS